MIYIGSDHAGFQLKKTLATYIAKILKLPLTDIGPDKFDEQDDYTDWALEVGQKTASNAQNLGIIICGSGQGVCMAANKVKGIRAAVGYSIEAAEMTRKHNHANVLCLAGRVVSEDHARAIVKKFLETEPDLGERHVRRVDKITAFEQ